MISFFLPIRKNSKRIKDKNIKRIFNYNFGLTEIKIDHFNKFRKRANSDKKLKNLKFEFIVSSDDPRVEKYLKDFKWIKFIRRPSNLAKDDCLDKLVEYTASICKGDHILWTHVTSPLFDHICYEQLLKYYIKNVGSYDSCFTADKLRTFIYNQTKKKWISHNSKLKKWPRTQDLNSIYAINHAAFISRRSVYVNKKDRIGAKPLPMSFPKYSLKTYDIDDNEDLTFFKKYLKKERYNAKY